MDEQSNRGESGEHLDEDARDADRERSTEPPVGDVTEPDADAPAGSEPGGGDPGRAGTA